MIGESLDPLDILRICSVPEVPRVFVLPTKERPSRILSQQRRALNLAHALLESELLREGRLAIIGGGFGGLTAAAYAALQGIHVQVLEKSSILLDRFAMSRRYIDPRMYDWPSPGWDISDAALPVLNWSGDIASRVAKRIVEQFESVRSNFDVELEKSANVECPVPESGPEAGVRVTWRVAGKVRSEKYDAAIVAIGFGPERVPPSVPADFVQGYWNLTRPRSRDPDWATQQFEVVGNGDGALADLIGIAAWSLGHRTAYAGDFRPFLRELFDVREKVLELEYRTKKRLIAGGVADEQNYANSLRSLIRQTPLRPCPIARVTMYTHGKHYLDLRGTYAANRALLVGLFDEIRHAQTGQPKSRGSRPRRFGPFSREDAGFVLRRAGPEDLLQRTFEKLAPPNQRESEWRNQLALSERPISSAAWSQRARWTSIGARPPVSHSLPRLSFASDWFDPYVQRLLRKLDAARARRLMKGLLRLHCLLFDEVCVTDAALLDGCVLVDAISDLTVEERTGISAFVRSAVWSQKLGIIPAAAAFLTTKHDDGGIYRRKVELSSLDGLSIPAGQQPLHAPDVASVIHALQESDERLSQIVRNATVAAGLLDDRLRRIPRGPSLAAISPQYGLLGRLKAGTRVRDGCMPRRAQKGPDRCAVFEHLRSKARNPDQHLFLIRRPEWIAEVAMWYNAAYNTTIARRNGCTACEALWHGMPDDAALGTADRRRVPSIAVNLDKMTSDANWQSERAKLAGHVAAWRRGHLGLHEVLPELSCAEITVGVPRWDDGGTAIARAENAIKATTIKVVELRNEVPESYSPSRALLFYSDDALLSTILIGESRGEARW